jgi:hypothetical protein
MAHLISLAGYACIVLAVAAFAVGMKAARLWVLSLMGAI